MKEVVAASDAPWGSAHHHFPAGKEQLGVAALEWSGADFAELMSRVLATAETAPEGAHRVFGLAKLGLERSDFSHGCPIGNVAADSSNRSEVFRSTCATVFGSLGRPARAAARRRGRLERSSDSPRQLRCGSLRRVDHDGSRRQGHRRH